MNVLFGVDKTGEYVKTSPPIIFNEESKLWWSVGFLFYVLHPCCYKKMLEYPLSKTDLCCIGFARSAFLFTSSGTRARNSCGNALPSRFSCRLIWQLGPGLGESSLFP